MFFLCYCYGFIISLLIFLQIFLYSYWVIIFIYSQSSFNITKDLYSRKDSNLVFSRVARFYATTEQKLILSFWNTLKIRRKIDQLHQSSCYTSSIYYTTQNNPWICRYRFNGKVFLIFSSPGHRPCELLSWVSVRRPSVRPLAFHI